MFRIVTGPFHPTLEQALAEDVRSLKSRDAFSPLAIIVPSALLADRVKRLLAVDSRLPLLNCHVLTLHQFGLRLRDTSSGRPDPTTSLDLVDDFYFEQLVRHIVTRQLSGLELLSRLAPSAGAWKALWATLRDLKDAAVTPATALKAVREGLFEDADRPWLETLFTLQAATGEGSRSLGVGSPDDLLSSLACDLSRSVFLNTLTRVYCYGFYDLLQVQLSFLHAVANCIETTLYIPLESTASYTFARRFFERHVLPLGTSHDDRGKTPLAHQPSLPLSITSVAGSDEELAAVCREILSLVEVQDYRFDDIGVVARSLEPYRSKISSVFNRHLVPFISSAGQPISREPLVKVLSRLASLPVHDFERSAMLDVVSSPFYRLEPQGTVEPRPDLWRIAVSTLGIIRGETEWSRLAAVSTASIIQESSEESDEDIDYVPSELPDPEQLRLLASVTAELIRNCNALPARGSVGTLTDAFLGLVRTHMSIPGWTAEDDSASDGRTLLLTSYIRQALMRLTELDPLHSELSWQEWTELFELSLEEAPLPVEPDAHRGVQVLDAMEARGLPFKALFVIGLNEQTFPRFIREDPFLRDTQRQLLSSTLGFAIEEKLAGHDEERLLFELLCRSATHRLYLSYQRSDEDGRVLVPSALIQTALSDPRFATAPEVAVPRRLTARVAAQPAIQELLPAQDVALSFLLHKQDAGAILEQTGQNRRLFESGLNALEIMERDASVLGPFDGILHAPAVTHALFDAQSISPTSLERYASCPFRYFAEKWLRLEPVRPAREDQLPPLTFGRLLHDILRVSYERLAALQWPDLPIDRSTIGQTIAGAAQDVFTSHAATQGTGHALLWALAQDQIVDLVTALAAEDEQEYRSSGFRPHSFEIEAEGVVALGATELKVHGKLDRVDFRQNPPGLRIVDYKFKQGREMGQADGNLLRSALRGWKLQPPLYGSMSIPTLPPPAQVQFLYLAPRWKEPIVRRIFEMSAFAGRTGDAIKHTIATLVQGIERREFFILPDGYCDHCEFTVTCRRHDQTAWWRSYRSPEARALRQLRKQKVTDD